MPTETDEDLDAAFESGFADETPTETPTPKSSGTESKANDKPQAETPPADKPASEPEPPKPPDAPKLAQITEAELTALREKAERVQALEATAQKQFGTAFGKIGGIERTLTQLQESLRGQQQPPIEEPKEFGRSDIERLVNERIGPELENNQRVIEQKFEVKRLDDKLPDWRNVVSTDGFKGWIEKQPDGLSAKFYESWDAGFIGRTISDYTSHIDAEKQRETAAKETETRAKADAEAKAKAEADKKKQTRTQRLEAAVQPKGTGSAPARPSEEDEFTAGFYGR